MTRKNQPRLQAKTSEPARQAHTNSYKIGAHFLQRATALPHLDAFIPPFHFSHWERGIVDP